MGPRAPCAPRPASRSEPERWQGWRWGAGEAGGEGVRAPLCDQLARDSEKGSGAFPGGRGEVAADSAATAEPRPLALASPPPPPPLRLLTSQTRLPPSEPGAARRRRPCRPGWEGLGGTRGGAAGSAAPTAPAVRPAARFPRSPALRRWGETAVRVGPLAGGVRGAAVGAGTGGDGDGDGGWEGDGGRAGRDRAPVCTIPTLCAPSCAPPNFVKRVGTIRRGRGVRGNLFIKSIPSRHPAQPPRATPQDPAGQERGACRSAVPCPSVPDACLEFSRVRASTGGEGIG